MKFPALAAFAALALGACADHDPVAQLMDCYLAAWTQADPAALAANYAADGRLTTPDGASYAGQAAITQFYTAAFAQGYAGRPGHAHIDATHKDGANQLSATGEWSIEAVANHAAPRECGTFAMTAKREAGAWKIASLREIAAACPAQG
jgi:uncharacterized protein (TIGR02246 family)